jgi:hypothetical protein
MSKIFVRQRRHVSEGAGQPRFAIVAVSGTDLEFYRNFVRRSELEAIAKDSGAEVIYLPRGEHADDEEAKGRRGRQHRRARAEAQ